MARASDLVDLGFPAPPAILEGYTLADVTGAGTTQVTATAANVHADFINLTTGASTTGLILATDTPLATPILVFVASSTTGVVYPPVGGKINGGSTNAGINIAQNKAAKIMRWDTTNFTAVVGA